MDLPEITDLEQAYFELEKIRRQVDALSDFLCSKLNDRHSAKPKTEGMIDPRTGEPFTNKPNKDFE